MKVDPETKSSSENSLSFQQKDLNKQEILWLDTSSKDPTLGSRAYEEVCKRGIVFIKNVKSEQDLIEISKHFGQVFNPRHGSSQGVAHIQPNHNLEGKGYTTEALLLHTDRSGMENPPKFLMTTVKKQGESGGFSTFLNSQQLQEQLLSEDPNLSQLLRNAKMTQFRQDDGSLKCLPMFFDGNKIRCRFDDGISFSHSLAEQLPQLRQHLARLQIRIGFNEGEGYILDNHWWLHGRDSFSGDREILRLLINPINPDIMAENASKENSNKLILFDIDGTLLDSQAVSVGAFFKCMTFILGKEITLQNSSSVNLHGQTDLSLISQVVRLHSKVSQDIEEFVAEKTQQFLMYHPQFMENEIRSNPIKIEPCPGVIQLIKKIRELKNYFDSKGIHFGLLTGNSEINALSKIEAAGISSPTEVFELDKSVFGDTYQRRNDMLPGLWKKLKDSEKTYLAENTLIVGDTPLDVGCGRVNGAKVLVVATGSYGYQQLVDLQPDYILSDLSDVDKVIQIFKDF